MVGWYPLYSCRPAGLQTDDGIWTTNLVSTFSALKAQIRVMHVCPVLASTVCVRAVGIAKGTFTFTLTRRWPADSMRRLALACVLISSVATALPLKTPRLRIGEVKSRLSRFGVSTEGIVEAEALREVCAVAFEALNSLRLWYSVVTPLD